jgi:hypothetical protein
MHTTLIHYLLQNIHYRMPTNWHLWRSNITIYMVKIYVPKMGQKFFIYNVDMYQVPVQNQTFHQGRKITKRSQLFSAILWLTN